MNIHDLMNAMNVSNDVWISVWNSCGDEIIWEGEYERSTKGLQDLGVEQFEVQNAGIRNWNYLVTRVKIYSDYE